MMEAQPGWPAFSKICHNKAITNTTTNTWRVKVSNTVYGFSEDQYSSRTDLLQEITRFLIYCAW